MYMATWPLLLGSIISASFGHTYKYICLVKLEMGSGQTARSVGELGGFSADVCKTVPLYFHKCVQTLKSMVSFCNV